METEELHLGYVDENSAIEIVNTEEITVRPDKINVGFAQSSNLYEWQVVQTESFYTAFMESDGYHLNITDAHGDAERQKEQLESLINAPMDILFVVPVDPDGISVLQRGRKVQVSGSFFWRQKRRRLSAVMKHDGNWREIL